MSEVVKDDIIKIKCNENLMSITIYIEMSSATSLIAVLWKNYLIPEPTFPYL